MLRQLLRVTALAAMGTALAVPAKASEITGNVALSGNIYYADEDGAMSFFTDAPQGAQPFVAVNPQSSPAAGDTLTLTDGFEYNGLITPAIFAAKVGGQSGTLTLNTIAGINYTADGMEAVLNGTFDQAGYAQELATASFLLNSQYIGDNINLMMFHGIAQLAPLPAPEPATVALLGTGVLMLAGAGLLRRRMTDRDAHGADIA